MTEDSRLDCPACGAPIAPFTAFFHFISAHLGSLFWNCHSCSFKNPMYEQVVGHCLSQGHPVDAINVDRELLAALRISQGNIAAQAYRHAAPNATGASESSSDSVSTAASMDSHSRLSNPYAPPRRSSPARPPVRAEPRLPESEPEGPGPGEQRCGVCGTVVGAGESGPGLVWRLRLHAAECRRLAPWLCRLCGLPVSGKALLLTHLAAVHRRNFTPEESPPVQLFRNAEELLWKLKKAVRESFPTFPHHHQPDFAWDALFAHS